MIVLDRVSVTSTSPVGATVGKFVMFDGATQLNATFSLAMEDGAFKIVNGHLLATAVAGLAPGFYSLEVTGVGPQFSETATHTVQIK